MRAMPLAFPGNALVRDFDTQFMCGDALLVAPIVREGGEVDIALPPGGWYDLNTRQRIAGRQVLHYRAKLDQFPVFAPRRLRAAARPRGPAYRRDRRGAPLELLWVFGKPEDGARRLRPGAHRRRGEGGASRSRGGRLQRRSVW